MVSRCHAKANNKQCPAYNPEKPNMWIQYLDTNNLYRQAMKQMLAIFRFSWADPTIDEVLAMPDDTPKNL